MSKQYQQTLSTYYLQRENILTITFAIKLDVQQILVKPLLISTKIVSLRSLDLPNSSADDTLHKRRKTDKELWRDMSDSVSLPVFNKHVEILTMQINICVIKINL